MKIAQFDTQNDVFVIAEIGNNHEGSFTLAEELIGLAAETGVQAVKFQMIHPEQFVNAKDENRFNQLKKFQLTHNEFEKLFIQAKKLGLYFLTTPFDLESVDILDNWVPAFKIASSDNDHYPLLEKIANKAKPIIMSAGLADINELSNAITFLFDKLPKNFDPRDVSILHCVTSYPTPDNDANLNTIPYLISKFPQLTIGYSDHTLGIEACVLAHCLGARIIEKHFTIDHHYSSFRDHQLSANPQELRLLMERLKHSKALLGEFKKKPTEQEINTKQNFRRSIATKSALPQGHRLSREDLIWVRPGTGFAPGLENQVIGKKLKENLARGYILTPDVLE